MNQLPFDGKIRCGGMGVFISNPKLTNQICRMGQYGTLTGVTLERVLACILQHGDPNESIRRALATFPFQGVVKQVMDAFFVKDGIKTGQRFRNAPVFTVNPSALLISMVICANYAFVRLAKEGHTNPVTINYLEKIAMPHIYALTGAMLADVDFVTMGAGIALQIPKVLDCVANGKEARYNIPVIGVTTKNYTMSFDPATFFNAPIPDLQKPGFIPIIASNLLGDIFIKKLPKGSIAGFVVEEPTAGGHNAPPRKPVLDEQGQILPIYGQKDEVNYERIAALGLPFWIGGNRASPEALQNALSLGAQGIQVGSIFALCEESGMNPELRRQLRQLGYHNQLQIRTDMRFSPTGFPFKVACLAGTLSDPQVLATHPHICTHGVLVVLYEKPDGTIGYRCPSEPESAYLAKGGNIDETSGRGCLCNGLLSTCDMNNPDEPAVITLGDGLDFLMRLMKNKDDSYTAEDAIKWLLGQTI